MKSKVTLYKANGEKYEMDCIKVSYESKNGKTIPPVNYEFKSKGDLDEMFALQQKILEKDIDLIAESTPNATGPNIGNAGTTNEGSKSGYFLPGVVSFLAATLALIALLQSSKKANNEPISPTFTPFYNQSNKEITLEERIKVLETSGTPEQQEWAKRGIELYRLLKSKNPRAILEGVELTNNVIAEISPEVVVDTISKLNGVTPYRMQGLSDDEYAIYEKAIASCYGILINAAINPEIPESQRVRFYEFIENSDVRKIVSNTCAVTENYLNSLPLYAKTATVDRPYDTTLPSEAKKFSPNYKNMEELYIGYQLNTVMSSHFDTMNPDQQLVLLGLFKVGNAEGVPSAKLVDADGADWYHTRYFRLETSEWWLPELENGQIWYYKYTDIGCKPSSKSTTRKSPEEMDAYVKDQNSKSVNGTDGVVGLINVEGYSVFVDKLYEKALKEAKNPTGCLSYS